MSAPYRAASSVIRSLATFNGGYEGADVESEQTGQPRGGHDHVQDILAQFAAIDELDARYAHAFLIDFARLWRPAREIHAPDVRLVRFDAGPGDDLAVDEDRPNHLNVILMQGCDVWIVADEHVAFVDGQLRFLGDVTDESAADRRLVGDLESHRRHGAVGEE